LSSISETVNNTTTNLEQYSYLGLGTVVARLQPNEKLTYVASRAIPAAPGTPATSTWASTASAGSWTSAGSMSAPAPPRTASPMATTATRTGSTGTTRSTAPSGSYTTPMAPATGMTISVS